MCACVWVWMGVCVSVRACGMDGRFLGKPGIRKESMSDVIVNETFIT